MVSIIVLSYNTQALLRECLQAIFAKLQSLSIEVVVLDNASTDQSVAMVKKEFPTVQLIESKENLGFAKGVNVASRKAKGEYLLFLNSDATILDEGIQTMIEKIERSDDIGVIGGSLLNRDETTSQSYGKFYTLFEVFRLLFLSRKTDTKVLNNFSEVDWVSGGFMLIRADVFKNCGGFDEHFFMYIEDMELCYRLRNAGKKILYCNLAKARHVGQGSSNRTFAIVNIFKGIQYFYRKHRPGYEYFVVQLLLLTKSVGAYSVGFLTGNSYLCSTYSQALRILI